MVLCVTRHAGARCDKSCNKPPTPTQLNCRVELRRRCVLNSQLVGDSLDESKQFADNEIYSCVVSAVWTHQSSVVTQFPIFCTSHIQAAECNLGHDSRRVCTHRRHNSTQLDRI